MRVPDLGDVRALQVRRVRRVVPRGGAPQVTPALCATMLKPIKPGHHHAKRGFFGWFNRMFDRSAHRYERGVARVLHHSLRYMLLYLLLLGGLALLFIKRL